MIGVLPLPVCFRLGYGNWGELPVDSPSSPALLGRIGPVDAYGIQPLFATRPLWTRVRPSPDTKCCLQGQAHACYLEASVVRSTAVYGHLWCLSLRLVLWGTILPLCDCPHSDNLSPESPLVRRMPRNIEFVSDSFQWQPAVIRYHRTGWFVPSTCDRNLTRTQRN